jgi:hypothetical protein
MDLGCYLLNAARQVGRWLGMAPSVVSAEAMLKKARHRLCHASRVRLLKSSTGEAALG